MQYVREADFENDEGKLFFYLSYSTRTFWMPNTYFNLDIIYLDAADPSPAIGVWTSTSDLVFFDDVNSPNTLIEPVP